MCPGVCPRTTSTTQTAAWAGVSDGRKGSVYMTGHVKSNTNEPCSGKTELNACP
ncbi:hypothetical protein DPMN_142405 [Dreissena polymorpha]|uniref:Uncharacterized protein n=1 Tax=Dreissena polymorpha TaxID=45954 RepID=A0A9D4GH64_DREPO|nr:hypothetical protein DPMN_142405 [Dreissena polymorpha]